ncbi:MAG: acyltransferase, partial [Planctomycetota bacterium]
MSLHRLPYRPDWDGLRAVAILSVLLCHAGLGFPGGFVGVDLFFVLSGFLITRLILKDLDQGSFSLAAFGERRLRRILPALGLVTVFTLVAGYLFMAPAANHALGQSAIALFALVPNFYFWWQTGYFSEEAASKPLLHTWS